MRQRLGARGMPENVGELNLQQGELRHGGPRGWGRSIHRGLYHSSPRKARCCSDTNSASSLARCSRWRDVSLSISTTWVAKASWLSRLDARRECDLSWFASVQKVGAVFSYQQPLTLE